MYTVMIVDDMEIMRRRIKRLNIWKDNNDFKILDEAEDGEIALEKLRKKRVDLLITDISMPVIDGVELLEKVYKENLAGAVVFLTEHKDFSFAKKAIRYDIFDYLLKPVNNEDLKELLKRVKRYLGQNLDIYYPKSQVDNYIKDICNTKMGTERINIIIDNIISVLDGDVSKIIIILQKLYEDIIKNIIKNHNWILNFLDRSNYNIDLNQYKNINNIKKVILQKITEILYIKNKFILKGKTYLIEDICGFILNNVESDINMERISNTFFLSKNHLGDVFKNETGITIRDYIAMVKIERAKYLLKQDDLKVYEIAEKLEYSVDYFSKLFKKHEGISPTNYKSKNINKH
ncbi:response regulator transcription factor [Senegalia massiliensis]|uniref:response regulator transcription factor n=1 Tax=Senegalia massiliensis TaxID=1720316 RepID=UPI00103022D1|nr:response regulator [Senegalia massiliensis]